MSSFNCLDCATSIPGSNCAYTLSRSFGWKKKPGCYYHCHCGYPVRAKEIRNNVFTSYIDDDKKTSSNACIYCENNSGQGHVYYGTFDSCSTGNGLSASGMSSVKVFERYSSVN